LLFFSRKGTQGMFPISRPALAAMRATLILTLVGLTASPSRLAAQGLPVETGSHKAVALWFIGAVVLGLALAYGIMRNRSRTRAQKQATDEATKTLYAREERDRAKRGF
jgi:hypothetical protein